jgi:hypothetical protein
MVSVLNSLTVKELLRSNSSQNISKNLKGCKFSKLILLKPEKEINISNEHRYKTS